LRVWDAAAGAALVPQKTAGVDLVGGNSSGNSGFAFSPDGHRLFYLPGGSSREAEVQVWDAKPTPDEPAGARAGR
jgi:hypothetical protein